MTPGLFPLLGHGVQPVVLVVPLIVVILIVLIDA
jgi:hypothetical protein